MVTTIQVDNEIEKIIVDNLNWAEICWGSVGILLERSLSTNKEFTKSAQPSRIPGHPIVEDGIPKVDDFIAMVVDMRDSSKHLLQAISKDKAKVSQLQRVFYETSALLPSVAKAIANENGSVTEYLGDGVLALFRIEKDKPASSIYAAHRAAKECIGSVRDLVNQQLFERYSLPSIDIGVGLSLSRAMVTLVGEEQNLQPKVIGECVYRATKLSKGRNEIIVDDPIHNAWPSSKDGKLRFLNKKCSDVNGYAIFLDAK